MTIAQARALVSGLIPVAPSPAAERWAHDAILDAAESFSPMVEDGGPGCAYLDWRGSPKFMERKSRWRRSLRGAWAKSESTLRLELRRARKSPGSRRDAAGKELFPASKEREFLDWIPLDVLDLGAVAVDADGRDGAELAFTLARWGIRRLGELARIEPRALGSRLGARGVELARLARGENNAPFVSRPRAELFAETVEPDYGIRDARAAWLRDTPDGRAAGRAARASRPGRGDLQLSLGLEGRGLDDWRVTIAAPTNEVRSILALIILSLEASLLSSCIRAIRITAEPRVPRPAQTDMFLPPSPAPDRWGQRPSRAWPP